MARFLGVYFRELLGSSQQEESTRYIFEYNNALVRFFVRPQPFRNHPSQPLDNISDLRDGLKVRLIKPDN